LITVEGLAGVEWADLWPRHFQQGDSEAWVGGTLMIALTRPFTVDEDQVFRWLNEQDGCLLYGVHHLRDGRDILLFERSFTSQSKEDAILEHRLHLRMLAHRVGLDAFPLQSNAT
jgi:hypothetical protein